MKWEVFEKRGELPAVEWDIVEGKFLYLVLKLLLVFP